MSTTFDPYIEDESPTSIEASRIEDSEHYSVNLVLCKICMNLPKNLVQCQKCQISVCLECIRKWNKPGTCIQRCTNTKFVKPSIITMGLLSGIKVACSFKNNGCKESVLYDQVDSHEATCKFLEVREDIIRIRKSPNGITKDPYDFNRLRRIVQKEECSGCGKTMCKKYLPRHMERSCSSIQENCPYCSTLVPKRGMFGHRLLCGEEPDICPECNAIYTRKERRAHICTDSIVQTLIKANEDQSKKNSQLSKDLKEKDDNLKFLESTLAAEHKKRSDAKERIRCLEDRIRELECKQYLTAESIESENTFLSGDMSSTFYNFHDDLSDLPWENLY